MLQATFKYTYMHRYLRVNISRLGKQQFKLKIEALCKKETAIANGNFKNKNVSIVEP